MKYYMNCLRYIRQKNIGVMTAANKKSMNQSSEVVQTHLMDALKM